MALKETKRAKTSLGLLSNLIALVLGNLFMYIDTSKHKMNFHNVIGRRVENIKIFQKESVFMTTKEVADIQKKMKIAQKLGNALERANLCEKLHRVLRRIHQLDEPEHEENFQKITDQPQK